MPEVREIKVKQMDQGCPKCSEGFMRPTGIVHPGPVPMFEHACTACGHKETYNIRYPYSI